MKESTIIRRSRTIVFVLLPFLASVAVSCAETKPYINKNVKSQVELRDTPSHLFTYVNVTDDSDSLTVFGKVNHLHQHCDKEGHVDLAVVSKDKTIRHELSMVLKRGSKKVRGWHGAAFRARLGIQLVQGDTIRLAFHDNGCIVSDTFICQSNVAATHQKH